MAYEDSRYLEFKLSRLVAPIALAPAARIRRDIGDFGRGGGKLTSLVDKRVMLTIPAGALKIACTYSIQVRRDQTSCLPAHWDTIVLVLPHSPSLFQQRFNPSTSIMLISFVIKTCPSCPSS